MSLLLISLSALIIGPVLYRLAWRARGAYAALDGFVVVAIVGLVLAHIIPHSVETAGFGAIGAALIGLLGPGLIERSLVRAARGAHLAAVGTAVFGLAAHAFFDGLALSGPGDHGNLLGIAIALHRLPIAITVWWLLAPSRGGVPSAVATLAMIGAATVGGFAASDRLAGLLDATWIGYLQSLVAGSVLHVVFHRTQPEWQPLPEGRWKIHAGLGGLAALAMVVGLSGEHLPMHAGSEGIAVADAFFALSLETAPALLLAFGMAGLVQVFLPTATLAWMKTGRASTESVRGMVFGLPLPICSCGVIPLYQSLVQAGVPATAAMAFLVATPELGLDAVLISLPLLGAELTVARVGAAAIVAFLAGWWVGRIARAQPVTPQPEPAKAFVRGSLLSRIRTGLRFGFGEVVDHTGPWLLLGIGVASLVEPMLSSDWFSGIPGGLDVPMFALLGMPSYVCASGATPFVAVLLHKGVSPGAALAFLLTGPATNVTTFGILSRLHGRRIALLFGAVVAGAAIALGFAVNALLPEVGALELHEAAAEGPSLLQSASLIALAVIFLLSLLRQGPRGFIAQVLAPYGHEAHDHDHDHDHGHGHDDRCC